MIAIGVVLGGIVLVFDAYLKRRGGSFRAHLMPIAVGMYLPFGLAIPILIGGIIAHVHSRATPATDHHRVLHRGVLFSSGVIAGQALMSVGLACLAALGVPSLALGLSTGLVTAISIVTAIVVVTGFVKFTSPQIP